MTAVVIPVAGQVRFAAAGQLLAMVVEEQPAPTPVFIADGVEITSLTIAAGSPRVDLVLPVSLTTLEAACWCDPSESAASVEAMSDDELRAWAVGQLLIAGITGSALEMDGPASAPLSPEVRRYRDVIRRRLPLVFGLDGAERAAGSAA